MWLTPNVWFTPSGGKVGGGGTDENGAEGGGGLGSWNMLGPSVVLMAGAAVGVETS